MVGSDRSSTVWSHLSSIVKRVSGNIEGMWEDFPQPLVSGLIWIIHMLPITNNFIESGVVGTKADLGEGSVIQGVQDRTLLPKMRYPLSSHE